MDRDDWKWQDDDEMDDEEGGKKPEAEFPCPRCNHLLSPGSTWCGYCGRGIEERRPKKD